MPNLASRHPITCLIFTCFGQSQRLSVLYKQSFQHLRETSQLGTVSAGVKKRLFHPCLYIPKGQIQEKLVSLLRFIVNPKDSMKPEARIHKYCTVNSHCFCEKSDAHVFKGIVHPKMKILSIITHSHVIPNPKDLRSSSEHKLRYFWWNPRAFWPCIDSNATEMFPH